VENNNTWVFRLGLSCKKEKKRKKKLGNDFSDVAVPIEHKMSFFSSLNTPLSLPSDHFL